MKLKEKLFPAKDPAIIKIYGRFNCDLEERVRRQMKEVFAKKENSYNHLAKPYIDIWLEKQIRRAKIELM